MSLRPAAGLLAILAALLVSPAPAGADTANHEGALEQVAPTGLRSLNVTGWARDRGGATPVRVEILVNSVAGTTVTANLPRKGVDRALEAAVKRIAGIKLERATEG